MPRKLNVLGRFEMIQESVYLKDTDLQILNPSLMNKKILKNLLLGRIELWKYKKTGIKKLFVSWPGLIIMK